MTTGQAARLCAVTPATVLNWIKAGRLPAMQTPGGHYRLRLDDLTPFLQKARPLRAREDGVGRGGALRCWEYLGEAGETREECRDCVVYRVRASWCFQIAALGLDTEHSRRFCPTPCEECAYYRRVMGLPTQVLIVSADSSLRTRLEETASDRLILRFVRNAYEASAAVQSFLPAFALVDLDTTGAAENGLLEDLARDPRLPGLKTVVVGRRSRIRGRVGWRGSPAVVGRIEKPFGVEHIHAVIESFPVERA